tara:strand:+ start:139 stop:372 length:234 start_codon:yes stop_codon:yes gene_type:complete
MNIEYKKDILKNALTTRMNEVTEYQVNVDNFRLAIEKIGDDPFLQEFKKQLEELLFSTLYEQRKAQIMLEVVQSQLE